MMRPMIVRTLFSICLLVLALGSGACKTRIASLKPIPDRLVVLS